VLELLRALRKSNLLTDAQWQQLQVEVADRPLTTGDQVLQHLLDRHLLTPWQADMLRQGKKAFHLGKYRLEELLGTGAMGAVFRARQPGLDRSVTLKILSPRVVRDARMVARFRQEMRAVAALDDPHIVAALDAESTNNLHYLVMRWVPGEDLARVLFRHGPLPIPFACECVRQVAVGLQHAADRGLVHRDLKPSNLLLSFDNETGGPFVRILDFGLARFLDLTSDIPPATSGPLPPHRTADPLTGHGLLLGTPDYIAPEQARNTRQADVRSDLFSLGCTLFRLLTNEIPFPGDNPRDRLLAREQSPPPQPSRHRPEIPPALDRLVQRLLEPDPARRFQTPKALIQALTPFCDPAARLIGPSAAQPATGTEPGTVTGTPSTTQTPSSQFTLPSENSQLELFLDRLATEVVDPGSRRSPGVTRQLLRTLTHQARRARHFLRTHHRAVLATLLAGGLLVGGGVFIHHRSRPVVVIDWPATDPPQGSLTQSGQVLELPAAGTPTPTGLQVRLAPGPARLVLNRDRHESVVEEWQAGWFERRQVAPEWRLTAAAERQDQARQLQADLAEGADSQAPPGSPARQRWESAVEFLRRERGSPEILGVARALATQMGPLDPFRGGLARSTQPLAPWQQPEATRVRFWPAGLAATWNTVTDLAVWAEPARLAIASLDRTVTLFDVSRGVSLGLWELTDTPRQVQFLPGGQTLAVALADGGAVVLEEGHTEPRRTLAGSQPPLLPRPLPHELLTRVALDPQHAGLAVWNWQTGQPLRQFGSWPADAVRQVTAVAGADWVVVDLPAGVEIWNASSGQRLRELPGAHHPALDSSGRWLAVSRVPNEVDVHDLGPAPAVGPVETLESAGEPLAFLPGEGGLLTRAARRVLVWGLHPPRERNTLLEVPAVSAVSGLGGWLAGAEREYGEWSLWDLASGAVEKRVAAEPQTVVVADPEGRYVAGGGSRQGWELWPREPGWPAVAPAWSFPAALAPTGERWVARSGTRMQVRDTRDGSLREGWSAVLHETDELQFSPSGELLAVTGGSGLFRRRLHVWRMEEESELPLPELGEARVRGVAFHERARELFLAREGLSLAVCHWPSGTIRELPTKWPAEIVSLACDGRGRRLAVGCEDRSLWVYDRETRQQTRLKGVTTRVRKWVFSDDGRWLAGLAADRALLFSLDTGRVVGNLPEIAGGANDLQFDPQCRTLAVATNTGSVVLFALPAARAAGKSPGKGPVKTSGTLTSRTIRLGPAGGRVWQVCFSTDGRHLVTLNGDRSVEVRRWQSDRTPDPAQAGSLEQSD